MKKVCLILGIIFAVLLVIFGVVGYGLYKGYKVRSYATSVKSIMSSSEQAWSWQKLNQSSSDSLEATQNEVKAVKSDCETQLSKLNGLHAPNKDKNLESKTKEYFTIGKKAADNATAILDYAAALQTSSESLNSLGNLTGSTDPVAGLTALHTQLSTSIKQLKAINPPAAYSDFNKAYIGALEKLDNAVVKGIEFAKAGQIDQLATFAADFAVVSAEMERLTAPNESKALESIISNDDKAKLENYPAEINTEADSLSKTVFSF